MEQGAHLNAKPLVLTGGHTETIEGANQHLRGPSTFPLQSELPSDENYHGALLTV
jgi:hypothetical protein